MEKSGKIISIFWAVIALALALGQQTAGAQDMAERIKANPDWSATHLHPYIPRDTLADSPAPKGYKPFYISHYGRHGSRYHTNIKYLKAGKKGLEATMKAGLLTPLGEQLYIDFMTLYNAQDGMDGQLSPLGAREHQAIARRMGTNYKEVFTDKNRPDFSVLASTIHRSIISGANFVMALERMYPKLNMTDFLSGDRNMKIICNNIDASEALAVFKPYEDSLKASRSYDGTFKLLFNDTDKAKGLMKSPAEFVKSIFRATAISGDLDFLGLDFYKYIDIEDLILFAKLQNDGYYSCYYNSIEFGSHVRHGGRHLAKDIVDKADAAIKSDSRTAADFRFGHDTGLTPLVSILDLEGDADQWPALHSFDNGWIDTWSVPMGSNIQFIFYHSKKNPEVLVKILYNEGEAKVKGLEPVQGPYYKWKDIKARLLSNIK